MGKRVVSIFVFFLLFIINLSASAQCAMCRATVENNVSTGDTSLASGLNFGILYLFVTPYLMVAIVGALWYYRSRRDAA
ncbi:hypothetical protein QQ008_15695 [Fulvivirgaceae bacterium BMA10]|uniref:Uncharacterized protein n=1 Tax=Splendidivirga corallicola TaxID=3051826 RepID=A0ABT8KT68_9BACT|nr:hypothetical protein [Fulvivirgaceae bacterium BMA10]